MSETPQPAPRFWSDRHMAVLVALVLRGGVLLAALVTLIGGIGLLARQGSDPVSYHEFRGADAPYRRLGEIVGGALAFQMPAIIELGIVLLIATPVARVLLSLVGFLAQRDRTYTLITTIVLVILLLSLGLGGRL